MRWMTVDLAELRKQQQRDAAESSVQGATPRAGSRQPSVPGLRSRSAAPSRLPEAFAVLVNPQGPEAVSSFTCCPVAVPGKLAVQRDGRWREAKPVTRAGIPGRIPRCCGGP